MSIKTLLAVSILTTLPALSGASVIYQFSEPVLDGAAGFTYIASDYLTAPSTFILGEQLTRCDNSGMPTWSCTSARLNQTEINGSPSVAVNLTMTYAADPNDAFSTDELYDSFPGATLTAEGTYKGFLNGATFTVRGQPSETSAAPEPSTWALLLGGLGFIGWQLWLLRRQGRRGSKMK